MVSSKKIDQKTGNYLFLSTINVFIDDDKELCEEFRREGLHMIYIVSQSGKRIGFKAVGKLAKIDSRHF